MASDEEQVRAVIRKIDGEWLIVHEHHSSACPDPRMAAGTEV
jgi:hypothetical protein